jgi:hypothetical protein
MSRETIERACVDGRLKGAFRPLDKSWRIPLSTIEEQEANGKTVDPPLRRAKMSKEDRALVKRYFG